jgi:N-acetylglucosamine malate deacetylase 1
MNVLVIAPHPDDEAIGCGGTICLHTDRGDRVVTVFLTSGELALEHLPRHEAWQVREAEAAEAARVLGTEAPVFLRCPDWFLGDSIQEAALALRSVLEREHPEIVYVPHPLEWHPDHQAAGMVAHLAVRDGGSPPMEFLTYEVWTPLPVYERVEDITAVMDRKLSAIRCYRSQLGHFCYDRAVEGLDRYRGCLAAHCEYAEVFGALGDVDSSDGDPKWATGRS